MKQIKFLSLAFFTLLILLCLSGTAWADTLSLPKGLTVIGQEAFYGDQMLDTVEIPEGTREIGKLAFAYSGVTQISIPPSVTTIADDAFLGVTNLLVLSPDDSFAHSYADSHENMSWLDSSLIRIRALEDSTLEGENVVIGAQIFGNLAIRTGEEPEAAYNGEYTWERSGDGNNWQTLQSGEPVLVFPADSASCSYLYRCRYSVNGMEHLSNAVSPDLTLRVTVNGNTSVGKGDAVLLAATATNAKSYRWEQSTDGESWTACVHSGAQTSKLSFDADETVCSYQYRCRATDEKGNTGVSDPVELHYGLNRIILQKEQKPTKGFSVWGEQNMYLSFDPVPDAERFLIRCSRTADMQDVFLEFSTDGDYWTQEDYLWEYNCDITLYYTLQDGDTGRYPGQPGSRLTLTEFPEDAVRWDCTIWSQPFGKTYYVTVEAQGEGFEPVVSEPLMFKTATIDEQLAAPVVHSIHVTDGKPEIDYGLSSGDAITDMLFFNTYGGDISDGFAAFLEPQDRTSPEFGTWSFYRSATDMDWFGLVSYNSADNTVSEIVMAPCGVIPAIASTSAQVALDGTEVTLSVAADGISEYCWEYNDGDGFWLDAEGLQRYSFGKDKYTGVNSPNMTFVSTEETCSLKYRCMVTDANGNVGISNILKVTWKPDWRKAKPELKVQQADEILQLRWTTETEAPAYAVYEVTGAQTTLLKRVVGLSCELNQVSEGEHTYRVMGCTDTSNQATGAFVTSTDVMVNVVKPVLNQSGVTVYEGTRPNTTLSVTSPGNAKVTWSSANRLVATVSAGGYVTGLSGGTTTITAKVTTDDGYATAKCSVTVNPRTHRAVLYGLYLNGGNEGMANDAYAMRAALQRAAFQDGGSYAVTTLIDASKAQVQNAIRSAFAQADENDVSFFFFSGHGASSITSGSNAGRLSLGSQGNITGSELAGWMSGIPGDKLVMLDSCGSGSLIGKGEDDAEEWCEQMIEAFRAEAEKQKGTLTSRTGELARSGFHVITAAHSGEYAWGSDQGKLTFYSLCGAGYYAKNGNILDQGYIYADQNRDGIASYEEIYLYAKNNLDEMDIRSNGNVYRQHVQYYSSGGTIPFYAR